MDHYIIVYADDFLVVIAGNTRTGLEQSTTQRILTFESICSELNLKVSKEKTQAMLIGKNLLNNRHPIFKLNGKTIKVVKTLQYLGITLDQKLKFKIHLEFLKAKIAQFVLGFRNLNNFQKGISPILKKT